MIALADPNWANLTLPQALVLIAGMFAVVWLIK